MRFARAYLEITNCCNRSCSFCPGTKRTPQEISPELFRLYAQKLRAYTDYLCLHIMGEPLTHPKLAELLAIAAELDFRMILTTNGTLLRELQPILLRSSALHKVQISLQSFEANEADDLSAYLSACAAFATSAAENSILCCLRLWNLNGDGTVGENRRNPQILHLLEQYFPKPWTKNTRGFRLRDRVFLEWGERVDWPDANGDQTYDERRCYALCRQIGVLVDGTVVPCCLDRNGNTALGNLKEETVDEILKKPRATALSEGFVHRIAVEPLCRSCGFAKRFPV